MTTYAPYRSFEQKARDRVVAGDQHRDRIVALTNDGVSPSHIAAELGMSCEAVQTQLRRAGMAPSTRRDYRPLALRFAAEWRGGASLATIAATHQCSAGAVRRQLHRAGIVTHLRREDDPVRETSWQDRGACRNRPELDPVFFPHYSHGLRAEQEAAAWCGPCPVAEQCYAFGLANGLEGIWGGKFNPAGVA